MSPSPSDRRGSLRILFLSQYFPPEVGAAPTRAAHFARALVRAGHRVVVITGLPNHPSGVIQAGYRPGTTEDFEGVRVHRTWLYATPHKTPWTRLGNQLSFAFSALGAACRGGPYDLVLVSVPPLFIGTTGWIASRRHRAPFIVDVRDDWPRAAIALGEMRRGLVASLLDAQAGFLYQRAARVIAVTGGMRRSLSARGIDAGRQLLITNGADTDTFRPLPDSDPHRNAARPWTVLYSGTHGLIHGMDVILDAAEILQEHGAPAGRDGVRFVFIGDGVAKPGLVGSAQARRLDCCEFRPAEPPEDLARSIAGADCCVATTRDHPFSGETIPVKIFDYLAAGKPVVGAVTGDAAEVLQQSGGGIITAPGDGGAMATAILALASDPARCAECGRKGRAFVEANFSRRALGEKLASVCEEVVSLARGREIEPVPRGLLAFGKRVFDLLCSGVGLLVLWPVLLVIAILVRLDSPGPALFSQRRPARGSREFTMLKFRTMSTGTPDLATHLVESGTSYVTRVGAFLRRTSLDELPQLWNIFTGEMSLIGPRPALYNQYDLIALRQERGIDALRPGLTGWAQINGRDDIPLEQKVTYDEHYLKHISPRLDLEILLRTFLPVFSGRGGEMNVDERLIFLMGGFYSGGAETQARYLIEGLARRGHEVQLLTFHGEPGMLRELEAAGVSINYLRLPARKIWVVGALRQTHELAGRRGIRLVQSFLPTMDVVAPLLRLWSPRYRIITSRRSLDEYLNPTDLKRMRITGRLAHRIVGNSQAVAESVARNEGFLPPQVRVIPNGIPIPAPITAEERAAARAAFGLRGDAFVVGFAAHFRRGKGHVHVPALAARLRSLLPDAVLLLAGDPMRLEGRIHDAVHGRLAEDGLLDRVKFLGDFRDQRELNAAADAALNLSDSEGMSNSVLESMSYGVPVVATAVGGNLEVIRDGADGRLIRREAVVEETAQALLALAQDANRRRSLGDAARARVLADFSIECMIGRYIELYRELISSRDRRV